MNTSNSQRTQTTGCCLDIGTQRWQSPVSSDGQHRWVRLCIRPCWTPGSFLEAPRMNCKEKDIKLISTTDLKPGLQFFLRLTHAPVAGESVISAGAVFQGGCQATESSRHGIPLVETDTAAEGVASCCTLGTFLSRHLQELPSLAREGWRTRQKRYRGRVRTWILHFTFCHKNPHHRIKWNRLKMTEKWSCKSLLHSAAITIM